MLYVPFTAPNTSAVGAGSGGVFVSPLLNKNLTAEAAPKPVNLTAAGLPNPWTTDPGFNYANGTEVIQAPSSTSTKPASLPATGMLSATGWPGGPRTLRRLAYVEATGSAQCLREVPSTRSAAST